MSLDDRDWWREDRKNKEKIYRGDFSLHSKPYKVRKLRKMPYIQPNGSGSGSKNGCGTVFMAVIIVVAIIAVASTLGIEIPINMFPQGNMTQTETKGPSISLPGKIVFKREVPYKDIDINSSLVTYDQGVSPDIVTYAEETSRILLQNDNLLRQFIGNGWSVHLSDHELKGIDDVVHPAGYTDYKNRCIVIYAPLCEHAIFHEFGHYFSYIYECNFENIRAEMDSLYTEESRNFVSRKGEQETKYGKKNVHEYFACMFDNMIHDSGSSCCPKTDIYIRNFYSILSNTDYKDIYSVGYEYRVKLEELFQEYGATYTFLLDGEQIDPKTYDIHDFPPKSFTCQASGANGAGTLVITTHDIKDYQIAA